MKKGSIKRVPQRTCVACRQVRVQRELVRLVRGDDGSVAVDSRGKLPGRGAYLCRAQTCWEEGLKGGRLEHALRTRLSEENRQQLLNWGAVFRGVSK